MSVSLPHVAMGLSVICVMIVAFSDHTVFFAMGLVAQSVASLTADPGAVSSISGLVPYFRGN